MTIWELSILFNFDYKKLLRGFIFASQENKNIKDKLNHSTTVGADFSFDECIQSIGCLIDKMPKYRHFVTDKGLFVEYLKEHFISHDATFIEHRKKYILSKQAEKFLDKGGNRKSCATCIYSQAKAYNYSEFITFCPYCSFYEKYIKKSTVYSHSCETYKRGTSMLYEKTYCGTVDDFRNRDKRTLGIDNSEFVSKKQKDIVLLNSVELF